MATDPDLVEAYYNLGIVLDKAGQYDRAIENLNIYLEKAPNASDAEAVQELIYEIEYRKEETARQVVKENQKALEEAKMNIAGAWIEEGTDPYDSWTMFYRITKAGNEFKMVPYFPEGNINPPNRKYYLTVEGNIISGRVLDYDNGGMREYDMEGSVDPDGDIIRLNYEVVIIHGQQKAKTYVRRVLVRHE
ncbi:MAG: tetratricopeptide repeat protein [Candidatus Omnitrophica bacterium]|nr:tetratricopeptide repeat protein [Candidatus Omnitrophota bacterium]